MYATVTCSVSKNPYLAHYFICLFVQSKNLLTLVRPVARGGQGGQLTPPLRTKGPLFGTSRVKLLRPITING